PAKNIESSRELVSDRMQWQASPRNRSLRFNVDLPFGPGQFQRFHVAVRQGLSDVGRLALGKINVGEVAPLPPGRADIADAVVHEATVLDPVNLDDRVTLPGRHWELVLRLFLHDVSSC